MIEVSAKKSAIVHIYEVGNSSNSVIEQFIKVLKVEPLMVLQEVVQDSAKGL